MTADETERRPRVRPVEESGADRDGLAPESAFKILGNATRLSILDALWGRGPSEPTSFAELRKAVGMRDGSQFNYHLRKLVAGGFIEKRDGKYAIRQAGARVICTVRTGYLTEHPEVEPFETTGRCYACDGPLAANYEDEMFFVRCADCDVLHRFGWFPPTALLSRTPEAALLAHERVMKTVTELANARICSICNGPMERTVARTWDDVPVHSPYLAESGAGPLQAWYVCEHCGAWVSVTPGEAVVDNPAVVDCYRAHGVDVQSRPRWELPWTIDESVASVVSTDPFRVEVTVAVNDDQVVLTLDETFEVVTAD